MVADEYADEAAELDADPGEGTGVDDGDGEDVPAAERVTYSGRCHGGPWDTSDVEVRFPKGFLLVHMPEKALWIYDRRDDGDYYVRSAVPESLRDEGTFSRWRAAQEPNYDIRVLDPQAVQPAMEVKS